MLRLCLVLGVFFILFACKSPSNDARVMLQSPGLVDEQKEVHLVKITTIHRKKPYICSGVLIRQDVVLTAGHCIILYENGERLVPEYGSRIYFGKDFQGSMEFAGFDGVKDYYESSDADIGLIRLKKKVELPIRLLRLPSSCGGTNSPSYPGPFNVYGRIRNDQDGKREQYYYQIGSRLMVTASPNGSRGVYLRADQSISLESGDSGGPWVQNDAVIGVSHGGEHFATRVCDHVRALEAKLKAWDYENSRPCGPQTFSNKSDHSFVEFMMPAKASGAVISIKGGSYNKYVFPKCNRVWWSDLTFACRSGGWVLDNGSWDANGSCDSGHERSPYVRVGDF